MKTFLKGVGLLVGIQLVITSLIFVVVADTTFKQYSGWGSGVGAILLCVASSRLFNQDAHSALDYEQDAIEQRRDQLYGHAYKPSSASGYLQRLQVKELFTAGGLWFIAMQAFYQF
jgi:hypothetical protein